MYRRVDLPLGWTMGPRVNDKLYREAWLTLLVDGVRKEVMWTTIMRIVGDHESAVVYLANGGALSSGYRLNHFCPLLPMAYFGRYSKPCILNLTYVTDYTKGSPWQAIMPANMLPHAPLRRFDLGRESTDLFEKDFSVHGNSARLYYL